MNIHTSRQGRWTDIQILQRVSRKDRQAYRHRQTNRSAKGQTDKTWPSEYCYLAAMVWQKHMSSKNPIQLKRKEVRKAVKKTKSLPSKAASVGSMLRESSKEGNVKRAKPLKKNIFETVL